MILLLLLQHQKGTKTNIMSKKIDWETEAVPMIKEYQNDASTPIKNGTGEKLHGIMFNKADVQAILNNTNANVEQLFLICAKTGQDGTEQFHMVLAGVDDNNEIVTEETYNWGTPCPSQCSNLQEALGE
jgi:hypothetical protein